MALIFKLIADMLVKHILYEYYWKFGQLTLNNNFVPSYHFLYKKERAVNKEV